MPPQKTEDSWLVLNLPPDATQLERGAEIFRLVCRACHGDLGQGLIEDWIVQWAPEDQNCWQSKCHAANHPPDGFVLPRYVPPVVGPPLVGRFATALDLYAFVRARMPWQAPGSLQDAEYWDLTAHLLDWNGLGPVPAQLDASQAAEIRLHPEP